MNYQFFGYSKIVEINTFSNFTSEIPRLRKREIGETAQKPRNKSDTESLIRTKKLKQFLPLQLIGKLRHCMEQKRN